MPRSLTVLMVFLLPLCQIPRAAEPVGYFVEAVALEDLDDAENEIEKAELEVRENKAVCIRNGERIPVTHGMEAYAGDVLSSDESVGIAVAFLDSSAVTVRPGSTIKIVEYAYPAKKEPTRISVESGKAFFTVSPRPAEAHFFVHTAFALVDVKGTKFEVFSNVVAGVVTTSVAVTDGTVTLNASGAAAVDILNGTQRILTILNINGFPALPGTLTKGNLGKDEIARLKGDAIQDIQVSIGKPSATKSMPDVKIKSMTKNCDGTTTFIKLTEKIGKRSQVSTTTIGADNKTISKITEKGAKKSLTILDGTLKISEKMDTGAGKVTMKDSATKLSYKGTITTLANGVELATATAKDGSKILFARQILPDGTKIETKTVFAAGATEGVQTTKIYRNACDVQILQEQVTNVQAPDGDFVNVAGTVAIDISPPGPPSPQLAPIAATPTTLLQADPPPVSP